MSEQTDVRWHITDDGTVLQSYPKALVQSNPQHAPSSELQYVRFATTRRLKLSDLRALDERLSRFQKTSDLLSRVMLVVAMEGIIGTLAGWLVMPYLGVTDTVSLTVLAISLPPLALGILTVMFMPGLMRQRFNQIYVDAGFESDQPRTVKSREALPLIEAPRTVSAAKG